MKIVVLDGYTENPGDLSWAPLEALGELTVYDATPLDDPAEAIRRVGDAEVAIVTKTPLPRAVLEGCPNLRYVTLFATGYNIVDIAAARELGIPVSNIPGYSTDSVAQLALALLLELCSRPALHDSRVRAGQWPETAAFCAREVPLMELAGKTAGIIGFGAIGRRFGQLVKALGMEVLASGSRPTPEGRAIGAYVPLEELLARSDVISLHCPLLPENKGLINKDTIARMKDGVILLNTARGGLVVEEDLAAALISGKVYAAGVDVVSAEPIAPDNPLLSAPNCLITPHIGWAPQASRRRAMDMVAVNVKAFLAGAPIHVVNP